jgi:hypothetical protein
MRANQLTEGTSFPSPRTEERVVRAVCDYGRCSHSDDRPDSVHVRGDNGNDWFIALVPNLELHACDDTCPRFLSPHSDEERLDHTLANRKHA